MIKMQAEICRILSNPARFHVIKLLCDGERNAAELLKETGLSKANLSQHMSVLVHNGIAVSRRDGKAVYYRLEDRKISKACTIMQEVVIDGIKRKTSIINRAM